MYRSLTVAVALLAAVAALVASPLPAGANHKPDHQEPGSCSKPQGGPPKHCNPYGPTGSLTVSSTQVARNDKFLADVEGCAPKENVTYTFASVNRTVKTNNAGKASEWIKTSKTTPLGPTTLTATCGAMTMTATVTVVASATTIASTASSPSPFERASDGANEAGAVALLGLLLVGLYLAVGSRRSRTSTARS